MQNKTCDKQGKFTYEWIADYTNSKYGHYRIADPRDNAVGFCHSEHNAVLLTDALNAASSATRESVLEEAANVCEQMRPINPSTHSLIAQQDTLDNAARLIRMLKYSGEKK